MFINSKYRLGNISSNWYTPGKNFHLTKDDNDISHLLVETSKCVSLKYLSRNDIIKDN